MNDMGVLALDGTLYCLAEGMELNRGGICLPLPHHLVGTKSNGGWVPLGPTFLGSFSSRCLQRPLNEKTS